MREVLFAIALLGLWGFASTAPAGEAESWQDGYTQYRYNPMNDTYQATPQGEARELKQNQFSKEKEWSYEKPGVVPQHNPFSGEWEYAK